MIFIFKVIVIFILVYAINYTIIDIISQIFKK